MKNGYSTSHVIVWTEFALNELAETYAYLEHNFSEQQLYSLSADIEKTLNLIAKNPEIFPYSDDFYLKSSAKVRRAVIKRFNTLYYRKNGNSIEILSFFSNRKNLAVSCKVLVF